MKVVNAWGFEYKSTAFVWCKKNKISDNFRIIYRYFFKINKNILIYKN